nr:hypothetical protein [uncultured Desulfobacter sp.]
MRTIPEKDWKYLSKIKQDMLNTLCLRIHKEAKRIIDSPNVEEIKKYHKLFKHIQSSDEIISRCFDGWKRSDIALKISQLLAENLLIDEQIQPLSDETKGLIEFYRSLNK